MPTNYYSGADGKTGNALRLALQDIIDGHTNIGYDNLKYLMKYSDTKDADGINVIDIYSDCEYTSGSDALSWISSGDVGAGMNREHTVPQSWFNKETPMVGDAFHIYPTDAKSNNNRSSYLYGELDLTKTVTKYTGTSGGKTYHELGGKGTSKWSSSSNPITYTLKGKNYVTTAYYSGTIYEPDDEYKGDIARGYFYMATRYASGSENADCSNWSGGAFGSENNGLTNYTAQLMLKWHRQDSVSEKELIRNEVIYGNAAYNKGTRKQGNRNPFIDYPCLVEYIWGDSVGKNVDIAKLVSAYDASFSGQGCPCENSTDPAITSPTGTVNIGTTNTSNSIYKDVTVQGTNLESGSLTLTIGGTNGSYFKLPGGASSTTITKAQAEAGYNITITYTPTANGSHTATLTISGCGVTSHVVTLTGTCTTVYTATWMADGSPFGTSTAASGASPELPATNPSNCTSSRAFVGWTATSGYTGNSAPDDLFTTTAPTITTNKTFYAVYADASTVSGGGVVNDTINRSKTESNLGSTATSTWVTDFTITGNTGAIYTIRSMGISGGTHALQWNANGYLYCSSLPTSGGKLKSVKVTTGAAKNVYIYGNATAYSAKAASTSLSTLSATTSGATYTFESDYYAIGINGVASSTQITEIIISYEGGSTTTYKNYSTTCSTGPTVTVTFHANGGTGTMPAQTIPQSTNTTLSTNTFTREGYSFAGWATTSSGTKVYDDGGTINTATNIDLYAKWTALPTYTITWKVNNTTYVTGTPTTSVISGNKVTVLPSTPSVPSSCTGKTFVGWSATNIGSTPVSSAPADLFTSASGSPNITSTITFYAVFAEEEASTTTYERVTSLAQLDDADSIVIVNAYASSNFALPTTLTAAAAAPTETDGKITNFDSSYKWKLTKAGSYWTFGSSSSYLGAASMPTSSSKSADVSLTSSNNTWSITANTYTGNGENCFTIVNSSSSYAGLEYSSGWKLYYATNLNTSWYTLKLYVPAKIGTYVTACSCTYTITATTDDSSQGTVSVTTP